MAKSAELTACRPSLPLMPTPTWAALIMPTSLAPSPMASVMGGVVRLCLTSATMSAFCLGLTRQAMTAWQRCAASSSSCSSSKSGSICRRVTGSLPRRSTKSRAGPVMTSPLGSRVRPAASGDTTIPPSPQFQLAPSRHMSHARRTSPRHPLGRSEGCAQQVGGVGVLFPQVRTGLPPGTLTLFKLLPAARRWRSSSSSSRSVAEGGLAVRSAPADCSKRSSAAFAARSCSSTPSREVAVTRIGSPMASVSSLQVRPMLIAVSTLSPVSTHVLMPARARSEMVCGTPSCSLSSMAVAPTSSRSRSYFSATRSSASSLPPTVRSAASKSLRHLVTSDQGIQRRPSTSVRRPRSEKAVRCWSRTACALRASSDAEGSATSTILLSAPLQSSHAPCGAPRPLATAGSPSQRLSRGSSTTTLIRLRAEENLCVPRRVKVTGVPSAAALDLPVDRLPASSRLEGGPARVTVRPLVLRLASS
mmetsp:Transcript_24344/g.91943  ORF Transcript_24344/g.91943 Transcript_24344/m.91943 type:complete len:476 (-) Transcript_24344:383-1810(-)